MVHVSFLEGGWSANISFIEFKWVAGCRCIFFHSEPLS